MQSIILSVVHCHMLPFCSNTKVFLLFFKFYLSVCNILMWFDMNRTRSLFNTVCFVVVRPFPKMRTLHQCVITSAGYYTVPNYLPCATLSR